MGGVTTPAGGQIPGGGPPGAIGWAGCPGDGQIPGGGPPGAIGGVGQGPGGPQIPGGGPPGAIGGVGHGPGGPQIPSGGCGEGSGYPTLKLGSYTSPIITTCLPGMITSRVVG